MREFRDSEGDVWKLVINVATIKRVRDALGVNLADPLDGDPSPLARLSLDIVFAVDVVFVLVRSQAEANDVSDERFAELLGPDRITDAYFALLEELTDFFQHLRRPDVVAGIERQKATVAAAIDEAEQTIRGPAMDAQVARALKQIGDSVGKSAESSESILAPEHSAN